VASNLPTIRLGDLVPIHSPGASGERPDLRRLSDEALLNAANEPRNGDRLKVEPATRRVFDGNGRLYELLRRAEDPNSLITLDTEVSYEPHTRDLSMFGDMEP
jgi:hypothetical protein